MRWKGFMIKNKTEWVNAMVQTSLGKLHCSI